jgi:UDP-2,3-diacylglucosamine pyrophosphatase LpxH
VQKAPQPIRQAESQWGEEKMKIAIVSDIHLGDGKCKLVENGTVTQTYSTLHGEIIKFTGGAPLDYFVLNGDTLDFSINGFKESCMIAKPFFRETAKDKLAKEIVFIPGNHDKYIWDAVEWETNIIRRLKDHNDPREFRRLQVGLIDYAQGNLYLPGVTMLKGPTRYGTLFLEGLFDKDNVLPMSIVYPNLFIKTSTDTYLITHGHMLEFGWVLLSELLGGLPKISDHPGIKELEEYNIPLTSMICTGVGQAGEVSKRFYDIQQEVKKGLTTKLGDTLQNVILKLEKLAELSWYAEIFDGVLLKLFKKVILSKAKDVRDSRYDEEFFKRESVRKRFLRFYEATCAQASELKIVSPWKIIFGHTHDPFPFNKPLEITKHDLPQLTVEKLSLYNTGGWLKGGPKGAEVFFFDDSGTVSSVNVK